MKIIVKMYLVVSPKKCKKMLDHESQAFVLNSIFIIFLLFLTSKLDYDNKSRSKLYEWIK